MKKIPIGFELFRALTNTEIDASMLSCLSRRFKDSILIDKSAPDYDRRVKYTSVWLFPVFKIMAGLPVHVTAPMINNSMERAEFKTCCIDKRHLLKFVTKRNW